jgi:anti-sigma regulatory factor (Ser/Thr protein kinase)
MLIEVSESTQTGEARRKAVACAEDLRFDRSGCGAVAIATTEMATNLVKHAGKGSILLQPIHEHGHSGMRVMAIDSGPGIADIGKAMHDGHSTAGSPGNGLGAIRRLSDAFEIYSGSAVGTVVRADFWIKNTDSSTGPTPLKVGVVSEPIQGEEVSGDSWGIRALPGCLLMLVADGLGHGRLASEASQEAKRVLEETRDFEPHNIVHEVHAALKKTRGAAMAIAKLDLEKSILHFAGVGNISASLVSPDSSRGLASHNGTLGQRIGRVQEFAYPWYENNILVMHSDGLSNRWDLQRYPGIWSKHPSMIAAILHRDFCRGCDDVTVFVVASSS